MPRVVEAPRGCVVVFYSLRGRFRGSSPVLSVPVKDQTLLSSQAFFMTWDDHEVVNDVGPGDDERDTGVCESRGGRQEVSLTLCAVLLTLCESTQL